jgi:hypothetical protein
MEALLNNFSWGLANTRIKPKTINPVIVLSIMLDLSAGKRGRQGCNYSGGEPAVKVILKFL